MKDQVAIGLINSDEHEKIKTLKEELVDLNTQLVELELKTQDLSITTEGLKQQKMGNEFVDNILKERGIDELPDEIVKEKKIDKVDDEMKEILPGKKSELDSSPLPSSYIEEDSKKEDYKTVYPLRLSQHKGIVSDSSPAKNTRSKKNNLFQTVKDFLTK